MSNLTQVGFSNLLVNPLKGLISPEWAFFRPRGSKKREKIIHFSMPKNDYKEVKNNANHRE